MVNANSYIDELDSLFEKGSVAKGAPHAQSLARVNEILVILRGLSTTDSQREKISLAAQEFKTLLMHTRVSSTGVERERIDVLDAMSNLKLAFKVRMPG